LALQNGGCVLVAAADNALTIGYQEHPKAITNNVDLC
jgi:hypothetical protein